MIRIAILLILSFVAQLSDAATIGKQLTDKNTLCSLEYGVYENGLYVASTPMEDACRTSHYESRKRICEHSYDKHEIIQACINTYYAAIEQTRQSKTNSKK